MACLRHITFVSVLIALLGLAAAASAGERMKHTGSIVAIADDGKSFVLAEVGPWRVRDGATSVTYRTITLAQGTAYAIAVRAAAPPSGFPGDFVEILVNPKFVYLHDSVTVDCLHEGPRLVALKITVIDVPPLGAIR